MTTPNYALPEISINQSNKELTHNEAIRLIDSILAGVIDKDLVTPPVTLNEGDTYIIPASATGAWSGQTDKLAIYLNGAWQFLTPSTRWGFFLVRDELAFYYWSGTAWVGIAGTGDMTKAQYDTDNDGVIDNVENLSNQPASYYLDRANHTGTIVMEYPIFLEIPATGEITALLKSETTKTINKIHCKTVSGTATFTIKINSTNITGLTSLTANSTVATYTATGSNTMTVSDTLILSISSVSSPSKLAISIVYQ